MKYSVILFLVNYRMIVCWNQNCEMKFWNENSKLLIFISKDSASLTEFNTVFGLKIFPGKKLLGFQPTYVAFETDLDPFLYKNDEFFQFRCDKLFVWPWEYHCLCQEFQRRISRLDRLSKHYQDILRLFLRWYIVEHSMNQNTNRKQG